MTTSSGAMLGAAWGLPFAGLVVVDRAGARARTRPVAAPLGALPASVLGTTGASMLLIRPLLRANAHRQETAHVVMFFIFIVGNLGGVSNESSRVPLIEVAKLFVGIFVTMIPVLAMLSAGEAGAFRAVASVVTWPGGEPRSAVFFWATGLLSALLDNAPTYLVSFGLAGGNAHRLMTELPATLSALSAGAVFMGALTYIGNAPNFMIKAIAESRGVRMPGFFGDIAWSGTILIPLFGVVTLVWFR